MNLGEINAYLLLAFLQSGSVPELDMHESKHFLPAQFVHSDIIAVSVPELDMHESKHFLPAQFVHSDIIAV